LAQIISQIVQGQKLIHIHRKSLIHHSFLHQLRILPDNPSIQHGNPSNSIHKPETKRPIPKQGDGSYPRCHPDWPRRVLSSRCNRRTGPTHRRRFRGGKNQRTYWLAPTANSL